MNLCKKCNKQHHENVDCDHNQTDQDIRHPIDKLGIDPRKLKLRNTYRHGYIDACNHHVKLAIKEMEQ